MTAQYANVVINRIARGLNRVFSYKIPAHLTVPLGCIVSVPFGRERLEGVVIALTDSLDFDEAKVREIIEVLSAGQVLGEDLLALSKYLADYYMTPWVGVLQAMLPAGLTLTGRMPKNGLVKTARLLAADLPLQNAKQRQVVARLEQGEVEVKELCEQLNITPTVLKTLVKNGVIELYEQTVWQQQGAYIMSQPPELMPQQQQVLRQMQTEHAQANRPVLLHGVTGSGKTEVYLQQAQATLRQNKQVLLLVPEIALTPQLVEVFRRRLSCEIAVLHSGLTSADRRATWLAIAQGRSPVVIGARSAVFAPLPDLGLLILDEEHENSYKQENSPRFHARVAAEFRCRYSGAQLILGSATPSLESYQAAKQGKYLYTQLPERVGNRPLAQVSIVDMRQQLKEGNTSSFSTQLCEKIEKTLTANQQVLLFLNRRGYNTFVSCRDCGHVIECPHCAISMSYHQAQDGLKCHYCGRMLSVPAICPRCGSKRIKHFGAGTERIVEQAANLFPQARIARLDRDSISARGSVEKIFAQMQNREIDILVGTQLIAKGWDLPQVTLVGVMAADTTLNLPDFRAGERTFQLLTQVAGRSGRHQAGEVIVQTYQPENAIIQAAAAQDYDSFVEAEMRYRRLADYPPFSSLIRLVFSGEQEDKLTLAARQAADVLQSALGAEYNIWGPAPAPYRKVKDFYRQQIIVRGSDLNFMRTAVTQTLERWQTTYPLAKKTEVVVDIEPMSMM